ncbi:hypothetical protein ACKVMT_09310 [Halobacteriales archaeon Cl-PHB]
MSTTRPSEYRAVVAVRVPCDGGDDLATAASHRLERRATVETATIDDLRDLKPSLSATVVTVSVRVRIVEETDRSTVEQHLEAAPGVERVDGVQAVDRAGA